MRRLPQLTSWLLVLCLLLAGAVGLSPVLHSWVEHGGQGRAHSHQGGVALAATGGHTHADGSRHDQSRLLRPDFPRGVFVWCDTSVAAEKLNLSHIWQSLGHFFAPRPDDSSDSPEKNHPGHGHHSLAQSLAGGLIEFAADLPVLSGVEARFIFSSFPPKSPFLAEAWNAQTAGRGPPASQS